MAVEKFKIRIPDKILLDLQERLANTRWPHEVEGADWDYGTNLAYLKKLLIYWRTKYDWRKHETELNKFHHYKTNIDGYRIHFIHERGKGPNPMPLLLTHGWPDSFYRFYKIIPMLTDPLRYGGNAKDAFDVVVPSIPGFGFSDKPKKGGTTFHINDLWAKLMTKTLGYKNFGAHGGDWGTSISEHLARNHAGAVIGIHLTDVPFFHLFQKPNDLSATEKKFMERSEKWQKQEGAYALIQSTKPQSLAYGMNDSPAGLAAWIIEKFQSWSDCDGNIENSFSKDELLTNIMIYWVTETISSSFYNYYDMANAGAMTWMKEKLKEWVGSSKTPTGFAVFPKDINPPPREWAERFFNVQRYTKMPRGGHFAALEEPELLIEDIRAFFGEIRDKLDKTNQ